MQLKRYFEFVDLFATERSPLPCSSERVALYAAWLARSLKYRSVINYLSGLSQFLRRSGFGGIAYDDFIIKATLRGIRRVKGDAPRQAHPLLPGMLLKIFRVMTGRPGHVAWRAAVLCSFRGLLRKSQVTMSDSALLRRDFGIYDWGMIITVRKSKTIQYRERSLEIPVARCPDVRLCAVHWVERHFREVRAEGQDMAFRLPAGGGASVPMTYRVYQETLRIFANIAGLGGEDFSSHSLRRGGCTYLAMCGASIEELKTRGDWVSDAVFQYLRTPIQTRIVNDLRVATALAGVGEQTEVGVGGGLG